MGRLGREPSDHPQNPPQGPIGAPGQVGLHGRHRGSRKGRPRQHLFEKKCLKEKTLGAWLHPAQASSLPLSCPAVGIWSSPRHLALQH